MTSKRNASESEKAIKKCRNKCVICEWERYDLEDRPLVEGAHIKQFSGNQEDDKCSNIIALCPNHHVEFDRLCYYIETKTHELHHYDVSWEYEGVPIQIDYVNDAYLAYRKYKVLEYWKNFSGEDREE